MLKIYNEKKKRNFLLICIGRGVCNSVENYYKYFLGLETKHTYCVILHFLEVSNINWYILF